MIGVRGVVTAGGTRAAEARGGVSGCRAGSWRVRREGARSTRPRRPRTECSRAW